MNSNDNVEEESAKMVETDSSPLSNPFDAEKTIELNNRIRNSFMSYCASFLQENEEAYQCVQMVWNKYLQCVGDTAILAAFFDTLPFHIKSSVLPKYQSEIIEWCEKLFHIRMNALLCSTYYSETFQRVIRYALKSEQTKKGVIYVPMDFDSNLKIDLASSLSNVTFQRVQNTIAYEDIIDIDQLEELIQRDATSAHVYPFMIVANAGSALLGHCDQLSKIKTICDKYDLWFHVIGDLLGSLALLPSLQDDVNFNCDSLTIDIMKLFGIQNLPYLTFFLRSTPDMKQIDDKKSLVTSHPLYDFILHSPAISFLSVWSISQRCSNDTVLMHMKQSFDLTNSLIAGLKQTKTLRILNHDDTQEAAHYQFICVGAAPADVLPRSVVIFRFSSDDLAELQDVDELEVYVDLLNLWLFDKLSQRYPKMNLELLKSIHFRLKKSNGEDGDDASVHAIRFAPLEHLLDTIDQDDMETFTKDLHRYSDILVATIMGRKQLASVVAQYDNLIAFSIPTWAGIGAVRYIPSHVNLSEMNPAFTNDINTVQAELARKLQTNDSAFSLGGGADELDSTFFIRLGMIRKSDDLNVLLEKIVKAGKETESSLKYVQDMADKIRLGIEQVQKDLQDENQQLLVQEGLLRHVPLVSNIMSWWSPAQPTSPLKMKGRSFDLESGQIESTENIYVYRMQIKKQSAHAETHNDENVSSRNSDNVADPTEENTNQ